MVVKDLPALRQGGLPSEQAAVRAADLARQSRAPATLRAYKAAWARFQAWCQQEGFQAMPADPRTVGIYIAAISVGPLKLNPRSIELHLAGLVFQHRMMGHFLDRKHLAIKEVLEGLKRSTRIPARQARPLQSDDLKRLLEVCGTDLAGKRDRALILVGFNGALRRSELVGIDLEHLAETKSGYLLTIPWSKTDQEGEGAVLGIPASAIKERCPVAAVKAWIEAADIDSGPVFRSINRWGHVEGRLTDRSVSLILKSLAMRAGLTRSEVARTSGHSVRAGLITEAYQKDKPEADIQKHARHKRVDTTRSYSRAATVFTQNAAKGLLD